MPEVETHPVQANRHREQSALVPKAVTLAAYEVYSKVFGPQAALVTGNCRGGFGSGELVALLYARAFPKDEWSDRFYEALTGMKYL